MTNTKKQSFWKKITEKIPSPVKKVLTGVALFLTSQTTFAAPTSAARPHSPNDVKIGMTKTVNVNDLQVLTPIMTYEHYKENASPIGIISYFEANGAGTNKKPAPAAIIDSSKKYIGLIQMDAACRKEYFKMLKKCAEMTNDEFAEKYCLTNICNDEQITYLKNGCNLLASEIGKNNASSIAAHQRASKKYPYLSAVTQELFDCGDFYAPAIKKINKTIAEEGVDFKFEQLHPAIQFVSFRILALGQNQYAPEIGKSIAQCIKKDANAINYITSKEINQQMKDGLIKNILKPRPKVINIIDSLETKPIEYWLKSDYLYNAVNGGSSDNSWFAQREKEIENEKILTQNDDQLKDIYKDAYICKPATLSISPNNIQEIAELNLKRVKIKKNYASNKNLTDANDDQITFTLNGESAAYEASLGQQHGKKLPSRQAKKQLKKAKELAELRKNPAYMKAVRQAYQDRRV